MIFLNPAVLFGLLATSIPVLIHLLNLRKLKKIEFSTLTFLKELQKTKIRKIKLKQWILLVLRFLIILFLVAAFARPTIESVNLTGASSSAKTSAVILIDNSFSMSVVSENGSHFNHAKSIIKSLLKEFEEGDEVLILPTTGLAKEELNFTSNFIQTVNIIEELELTDISGDLNSTIIKAGQALSVSQNFNKEIYLFSDFQKGRLYNNENELIDLSNLFEEMTRFFSFNFSGKDVQNLAITDFIINNQIFEKGKPVSFSATVSNTGSLGAEQTIISLFINGKRVAQQSGAVNSGESQNFLLETTLNNSGLLEIIAEIEDDEILQDNKRFLSLLVPEEIKIAVFTDEPGDAKFLEIALGGSTYSENVKITNLITSQLSSVNLNNFHAIIIAGSEKANNLSRVKNYIEEGGKVMLMPGSNSTLPSFQNVCNLLELPSPISTVGQLNNSLNPAEFDKIDFEHPLFFSLFENSDDPKIESPDIYYYFKVLTGGKGKSIISLIDNSAFLSEYNVAKGKVFLISTAPTLSWSNFPLKGIFAPLINRSVFYLISENSLEKQQFAGKELIVSLAGTPITQLKAITPNREETINRSFSQNKNYLTYSNTNKTGIYKFYNENNLIDYFSVNTDPRESKLEFSDSENFEDYLRKINFKGSYYSISPEDDFTSTIYQARFGSELWKLFLIIALILALIEMAVSKSSKKDIASMET